MLPTDAKDKWRESDVHADNVRHYWNQSRTMGKWFTDNVPSCKSLGAVAWDAYYLYDAETEWTKTLEGQIGCATTLLGNSEDLKAQLETLLKP